MRDWRQWYLGELFTERDETGRADLPLLSITGDRGVIPREKLDRREKANIDRSKYLRIAPGDIGYNTMRMWQGMSALSTIEGIVSPAYTICIPGPNIDGQFAAYLFKLPSMIHVFHRYSQGLVRDTLSLKFPQFAKIRITIPELEEQRAIAEVLAIANREIDLLDRFRGVLNRRLRGVAHALLSGKIRLPA
jgi:type I restriction enzyme S subunit